MSLKNAEGRSFRLELKPDSAPAYIGRASTNAVRIDDSSISRLHASIAQRSNGEIVIADLGSSNGTYVNDRLLAANEARTLNRGDVIGVGEFKLTVSDIE
jgi:pSer/pThr/pTyr-binding forkhead associated (FHA) protein